MLCTEGYQKPSGKSHLTPLSLIRLRGLQCWFRLEDSAEPRLARSRMSVSRWLEPREQHERGSPNLGRPSCMGDSGVCAREECVPGVEQDTYTEIVIGTILGGRRNSDGNYFGREKNSPRARTSEGLGATLPPPPFLGTELGKACGLGVATAAGEARSRRVLCVRPVEALKRASHRDSGTMS